MQTHDNNRADKPGSKPRHPAPAGPASRRTHVGPPPDDVLSAPAPPTDDTPTIISRHGPATPAPPTDSDAGIRGRQLAHFELIEPIGVGGMAAVLRARDTQLDRFVALKILPPEMAGDAENVRRFHQEARSAAKLDHENVARVFFCGEDQRLHFIAFEFVEGENLRTILERRGRLPVAEALNYVIQVAAGLAHASARGVVHRDVKPSNIIITPTGRAKLVDMGLARTMERGNAELTQSGVTLGTFDYISPEQALEPRDADVRSDIYSLGCTFYHLLTGRTPTPEGTAAKKLHHHQHVNPVDPRHYVPDLPFDVVQILDRMMAKKPADRFQTPEELVQRLLLAAKALGMQPESPEGVLAVETSVPAPRGRPLVWAGLAAVAVVALVFFLDPLSTNAPVQTQQKPKQGDNAGPPVKDAPRVVKDGNEKEQPVPVDDDKVEVYRSPEQPTPEHLIKWLEQRRDAARIELHLKGDLVLTPPAGGAAQCLLVQAREKVTIRPLDPKSRPTIRIAYDQEAPRPLVALTVACPQVDIEGIRFVVDGCGVNNLEMAALHLRPGKHKVQRCEFVQVQPSRLPDSSAAIRPFASLVIESGRRGKDEVSVRECVFFAFGQKDGVDQDASFSRAEAGGRDAVVRRGPVKLDVSGCVFGPHAAAFRLEGDGGDDSHKTTVKTCTVLLPAARSAVFELPARATANLDVASCLFSRLDLPPAPDDPDGAVFLRQAEERPDAVTFNGSDNVYHDLDGYWAVADGWRSADWETFRQRNSNGRVVLNWPWALPVVKFVGALNGAKLRDALQLNHRLVALRKERRATADYVGAETVLGDRLVTGPLRPVDDKTDPPPPRVLLVEEGTEDGANGIYSELRLAVQKAQPGDVILIRHDGRMEIKPIHLNDKATSRLTIRPARRFRPVLTLGETVETDAALFRVQDGILRLEGLELRISPNKPGFKLVSAVTLAGDGDCSLTDCAVTLVKGQDAPAVLAVLAAKPDKEMKSGVVGRKPELGPLLTLKNTFVRGDGDLFSAKTTRPCQLDVMDSVAALSGTLVSISAAGGTEAPDEKWKVAINLTQSTTYLGGHLIRLNAEKNSQGIVPILCTASKCLFVAAGSKPFVQLEGLETDERATEKFSFKKEDTNGYGGYVGMLEQKPGGLEMKMATMLPLPKWRTANGEDGPDKVKLAVPADAKFTQLQPTDLARPNDEDAKGLGADVAKLRKASP